MHLSHTTLLGLLSVAPDHTSALSDLNIPLAPPSSSSLHLPSPPSSSLTPSSSHELPSPSLTPSSSREAPPISLSFPSSLQPLPSLSPNQCFACFVFITPAQVRGGNGRGRRGEGRPHLHVIILILSPLPPLPFPDSDQPITYINPIRKPSHSEKPFGKSHAFSSSVPTADDSDIFLKDHRLKSTTLPANRNKGLNSPKHFSRPPNLDLPGYPYRAPSPILVSGHGNDSHGGGANSHGAWSTGKSSSTKRSLFRRRAESVDTSRHTRNT